MADADVLVIGAGPVGMISALLAQKAGLSVILLERNSKRQENSRAIGITPPSLEILRVLSLDREFIKLGVPVKHSEIWGEKVLLGRVDFSCFKSEYRFILALPQNITESILEKAVGASVKINFFRGYELTEIGENSGIVTAEGISSSGESFQFTSRFAIACDGINSVSREYLGIPFIGAQYRETFLMGDFEDNSGWKDEARIYLTSRGSVESFPMPGGKRRYVLRTPHFIKENTSDFLENEIPARCSVEIWKAFKFWESAFRVQRYVAERFYKKRVFFCGDSAHVMSPIGGQNMNSGFADAELAVWAVMHMVEDENNIEKLSSFYTRLRKISANSAARRAEFLMKAGTAGGRILSVVRGTCGFIILHSFLRNIFIPMAGMLNIPFRNINASREKIFRLTGL